MHADSKIHLVGRPELQPISKSESRKKAQAKQVGDIVRETLTVARECVEALAESDFEKDQLLIDLVASLVVARLRKAGGR
jgi:hypothetical protein